MGKKVFELTRAEIWFFFHTKLLLDLTPLHINTCETLKLTQWKWALFSFWASFYNRSFRFRRAVNDLRIHKNVVSLMFPPLLLLQKSCITTSRVMLIIAWIMLIYLFVPNRALECLQKVQLIGIRVGFPYFKYRKCLGQSLNISPWRIHSHS